MARPRAAPLTVAVHAEIIARLPDPNRNPANSGDPSVANTPQARKRAYQNAKRRIHNHSMRSHMRTHVKKVIKAIRRGDRAGAEQAYQVAVPVVDRVARKGLIHRNRAARYKSRLNHRIRAL